VARVEARGVHNQAAAVRDLNRIIRAAAVHKVIPHRVENRRRVPRWTNNGVFAEVLNQSLGEDSMANTSKRGFASMNIEKQRLIASQGGRAAHAKCRARGWSRDGTGSAGRKGRD